MHFVCAASPFYTRNQIEKRALPFGKAQRVRSEAWGQMLRNTLLLASHGVVVHEQLPCEGFIIEVAFEAAHLSFEIVALADDVPGEVFFAVPLSAVGFLGKRPINRLAGQARRFMGRLRRYFEIARHYKGRISCDCTLM